MSDKQLLQQLVPLGVFSSRVFDAVFLTSARVSVESGIVPGYPNNRRLLPILGLGSIGARGIHLSEHSVQGGNLGEYLFVFCALKLERQLVNPPLDLSARELLREYELDRHRHFISRHGADGQATAAPQGRSTLPSSFPRDQDGIRIKW